MECLVVAGSAAEDRLDFYRALLRQADDVVAADGGAALCLAAGRLPDLAVGDFDSLAESDEKALRMADVLIERHPAEKDATDLDLALDAVVRRGHRRVTVTACIGGRLDHTLAVLGSMAHHASLEIDVLEPDVSGWVIGSRNGRAATLDLAGQESLVSVFAMDAGVTVTLEGFRYPLNEARLPVLSSLGVSNIIDSKRARIRSRGGRLVVLSPSAEGHSAAQRAVQGPEVV